MGCLLVQVFYLTWRRRHKPTIQQMKIKNMQIANKQTINARNK